MLTPKAKKSLGQHFLKSEAVIGRIAGLIHAGPADNILEIGPGPGALTEKLVEAAPAHLILIELDDHWACHHADALKGRPEATVLHQDALTFPWETLKGPWKVVGNLPYNVASPLMWDIVLRVGTLERAVFMVQKEVAERLWAVPGTRDYGALSAWIQSFVRVERGFIVGPGCFAPPPKVDSAVAVFTPLATRPSADPRALAKTLKLCFGQRRKQLQAIIRHNGFADAEAILGSIPADPAARPETLPPPIFARLAEKLFPRIDIPPQNCFE